MEVNKKILLIDDQEEILVSLKKLLSGQDSLRDLNNKMKSLIDEFYKEEKQNNEVYDVDTALSGKVGYELIKKAKEEGKPYSVVTIDMRMPGWDGLKTAGEIRKIDEDIEIIIVTAYTDIKREELVEKIGKPEKLLYLKKPFEREEILQVILSLTLKWSLEQKVKKQLRIIEKSKSSLEEVISGISEIEKSLSSSIKNVYKTILKELSRILESPKSAVIFRRDIIKSDESIEYKEKEFIYEYALEMLNMKRFFAKNGDYLFVTFFCETESCDVDNAVGIFKLPKDYQIEEAILDMFISHSNNLLKNASLYEQLEKKNKELTQSNIKLKEANALNKKFLVISSHELRTPGTIISAYAELLSSGKVKDIDKVSKGLENAAVRLNTLIEQMLEVFATSDMKNHLVVDKRRYGVEELISAIYEKVEVFLEKRGQTLEIVNTGEIKNFYIDKNKVVDFIFFNLVMNAIKFSKDGSNIRIIFEKSEIKNKAIISIIDQGIGMTDYEKDNMFKALFVGGNEKHHHSGLYEYKAKGLGLGLAIVKNIITMIEEDISCESSLENGTRVTFTLPIAEDYDEFII